MLFRCTTKALRKLRIPSAKLQEVAASDSLTEWYCNLVSIQRRQFFLFTHARSLFGFWVRAAGNGSPPHFGELFRARATEALAEWGFSPGEIEKVLDEGPDVFAKSTDRGVLGSMVDYAMMCQFQVQYDGGLERVGRRRMNEIVNESPMSRIGMESPFRSLRQILRTGGAA